MISSDAVDRFYAMMREREAIRLRRAAGQPWPWTDDAILRDYRFTNVRRIHDATTQALVREFYVPHAIEANPLLKTWDQQARAALLNCATARYFGTVEFMRAVGWQTRWDSRRVRRIARERLDAGERVYTGAYMISACGRSEPKEEIVSDFLGALWQQSGEIVQYFLGERWQTAHERLTQVEGFGGSGFMAKETLLDTRLVPGLWLNQPSDRFTWTPIGPGSRRGAARVLGYMDKRSVGADATLRVCRELFGRLRSYLPPDLHDLELHDVQFQLCEFDKYERTRLGQGRPRSRYRRPE